MLKGLSSRHNLSNGNCPPIEAAGRWRHSFPNTDTAIEAFIFLIEVVIRIPIPLSGISKLELPEPLPQVINVEIIPLRCRGGWN